MSGTTAPAVPIVGGTTSTGLTASGIDVMTALRRYLLGYENPAGMCARDTIGERLWDTRAMDTTQFPYGVMRLQTINDGRYNGLRLEGDLEVQLYGRPWVMLKAVNAVADLMDQAMREIVLRQQGLVICHGFQRATLPATDGAPIDGEVCTVRLAYTLAIWPQYLYSVST